MKELIEQRVEELKVKLHNFRYSQEGLSYTRAAYQYYNSLPTVIEELENLLKQCEDNA